ncbi:hypothetical protein, partial [Meiothermus taiwanensis]|uniref:hypothetical protein n=1 Tax=Meiothermus taiwanensis TaxID=172827 RepID=UPI0019D6D3A4
SRWQVSEYLVNSCLGLSEYLVSWGQKLSEYLVSFFKKTRPGAAEGRGHDDDHQLIPSFFLNFFNSTSYPGSNNERGRCQYNLKQE